MQALQERRAWLLPASRPGRLTFSAAEVSLFRRQPRPETVNAESTSFAFTADGTAVPASGYSHGGTAALLPPSWGELSISFSFDPGAEGLEDALAEMRSQIRDAAAIRTRVRLPFPVTPEDSAWERGVASMRWKADERDASLCPIAYPGHTGYPPAVGFNHGNDRATERK